MVKYTCWTPDQAEKYPYITKPSDYTPSENRIDLLIDAEIWKFNKQIVQIGVKNCHPEKQPQTFDIKIREVSHKQALQED